MLRKINKLKIKMKKLGKITMGLMKLQFPASSRHLDQALKTPESMAPASSPISSVTAASVCSRCKPSTGGRDNGLVTTTG